MVLPPGFPPPQEEENLDLPPPLFDLPGDLLEGEPQAEEPERPEPTRPKPDLAQVQSRIEKAVQYWSFRDERMDEDEALYNLALEASGVELPEELSGEVVVKNTPFVTVQKVAAILGSERPTLQLVAPSPDKVKEAERAEEMLRWLWEEWDRAWRRSLHGGLFHDLAHYLALRGWGAIRLSYDPEADPGEPPVRLELVDPRFVYPLPGAKGLRYVAVRRRTYAGEVLDLFGQEAEKVLAGLEDDEPVTLEAYYDDWWHAVLVEGKWVKEPTAHEYGFVPWVIVIAGGAPIRASERDPEGWTRNVGPSIFHGIKQAYRQLNKVLSQLATEVARMGNPAVIWYLDPDEKDEPRQIDLAPGATNYAIAPKERIEVIRTSPNPADMGPLMQALVEDVNRASLPPVLWGVAGPETSGFAISMLSQAARDAIQPVVLAMEQAVEDTSERALTLIRQFHDRPVGIVVRDRAGRWVAGRSVDPTLLEQTGTRVRASYRDLSPKDRAAFAQLAALLTDKRLISLRTAREQYLGLDNPDLENDRVLEELIYTDEEILKEYLTPLALARFDPQLFEVWLAREGRRRREEELKRQQQAQEVPHPGAVPVPGMPPQPVPPQFGPGVFNPLEQAQGAAQGPAGVGPVPPQVPLVGEP
jgi:hypothetical protein